MAYITLNDDSSAEAAQLAQKLIDGPSAIYWHTMGRLYRITGIFMSDDDANAHMMQPDNHDAVIAVIGDAVILADNRDKGIKHAQA